MAIDELLGEDKPKLKDEFNKSADLWREHCKSKSYSSASEVYLDSDAYRKIVSMGHDILPFIKERMMNEYETHKTYNTWLNDIKLRVFGNSDVLLFNDAFFKIQKDPEYEQYSKGYKNDIIGNPGIFWCQAVREIIPEFSVYLGKERADFASQIGKEMPPWNYDEFIEKTIDWLTEYTKQKQQ